MGEGNDEHGQGASVEQRWWARAPVPAGMELVVRGRRVGCYALENLSAGGALVCGGGDLVRPGEAIEVVLHLPRRQAVMLRAHVVRRETSNAVALVFSDASADVEDMIQDLVLRELERRSAPLAAFAVLETRS